MNSSKLSKGAARRRAALGRAKPDREVAVDRRLSGRSWINGREVGGTDARYMHLEHTSD
jgi:hypothetical protein